MSSHATVEEATGMGVHFPPKLLTLLFVCTKVIFFLPLHLAEMGKWVKISTVGVAACGIYGFYTLATLEHPHGKEVRYFEFPSPSWGRKMQ